MSGKRVSEFRIVSLILRFLHMQSPKPTHKRLFQYCDRNPVTNFNPLFNTKTRLYLYLANDSEGPRASIISSPLYIGERISQAESSGSATIPSWRLIAIDFWNRYVLAFSGLVTYVRIPYRCSLLVNQIIVFMSLKYGEFTLPIVFFVRVIIWILSEGISVKSVRC